MILVLEPNTRPEGVDYRMLTAQLERLPNVTFRVHREVGSEVNERDLYRKRDGSKVDIDQFHARVNAYREPFDGTDAWSASANNRSATSLSASPIRRRLVSCLLGKLLTMACGA